MLSGKGGFTNTDVPIKTSAKKYMRVTARKTIKNKKIKGVFRNAVKNTKESLAAGKVEEAQVSLKAAIKAIDKAVQKKVLKKNTAARKKSRLNAAVKKVALKK